jgi:hypothetical protein
MMTQYDRSGEAMKALALVVALLSVPAFVADYFTMAWPRVSVHCQQMVGGGTERGSVLQALD